LALPRFGRDESVAANLSPLHIAKSNIKTTRRVLRPESPTAEPYVAFGNELSRQSGHWRSRQRSTSSITIRIPVAVVAQRRKCSPSMRRSGQFARASPPLPALQALV